MVRSVLLELLLFCAKVTTPVDGVILFDVIEGHKHVTSIEVRAVDRRHDTIQIFRGKRGESIRVRFVDNGLYELQFSGNKENVDVARYFIAYGDLARKGTGAVEVKDSKGRPVFIQRTERFVYVSSPDDNLTFVIPLKYFKK